MKIAIFLKNILLRSFALFVLTRCLTIALSAQPTILFNNGAQVYTGPTAILHLNGSFKNDNAAGTTNVFENNGTMTVGNSGTPGSVFLTTNSILQGNGTYIVEQDWTNDATFTAGTSTVNFNGTQQEFITSTNATITTFNNLVLTGTGFGNNRKKTLQLVGARIGANGTLALNDRELETLTNTMFVLNPSATCVTNNIILGSEGFVSSSFNSGGSGYLSRVTNSTLGYIFPTGSSVSGTRYRPVMLTPASGTANTYTARLGYNDATSDGFNINALDTGMCMVNPLFYHEIKRSSGNDNAIIEIFYNQTADGAWEGLAKWNSTTPNIWNEMGTVTATANVPLSSVLKVNWADFSNSPYILSRKKPSIPGLTCSSVCANSTGNVFSAIGTGSIYTWTSPTGTVITSGQNTNAVTIDWNSLSGPVTVTVTNPFGCTSNAASCTVNPASSTIADFSSTSTALTYNFTDLSTGGVDQWVWDFGDGSFSTEQNPSHTYAACGPQNICLIASKNNCVDTVCSDIELSDLLSIPNIFTPDGDGTNDLFLINTSCFKEFTIEIFNRWGMKIVEITTGGWDGRSKSGVEASDGTYFYILKAVSLLPGKEYNSKGFISLVRKK